MGLNKEDKLSRFPVGTLLRMEGGREGGRPRKKPFSAHVRPSFLPEAELGLSSECRMTADMGRRRDTATDEKKEERRRTHFLEMGWTQNREIAREKERKLQSVLCIR